MFLLVIPVEKTQFCKEMQEFSFGTCISLRTGWARLHMCEFLKHTCIPIGIVNIEAMESSAEQCKQL